MKIQSSTTFHSVGAYVGVAAFGRIGKDAIEETGTQFGIEYSYNINNKFGFISNLSISNVESEGSWGGKEKIASTDFCVGPRYLIPLSNRFYLGAQLGIGIRSISASYNSLNSNSKIESSTGMISPGLNFMYAINPNFDLGILTNIIFPLGKEQGNYEFFNPSTGLTETGVTNIDINTYAFQIKLNKNF